MADFLKTGSDWLAEKLVEHGSSVTYTRGANSVTLNAHIGRRWKKGDDEFLTFWFRRDQLVLSGSAITPAAGTGAGLGDSITFTGDTWTVALCADSDEDESHVGLGESHEKVWKVHCIKTG